MRGNINVKTDLRSSFFEKYRLWILYIEHKQTFKKNCFLLPLGLVWCDFLAPHLSAYQTCVSMENEKLRTWSKKTRITTLYKNCWVGLTIEFFFFRCAHCTRLGYSKQKVCLKGERAALEGVFSIGALIWPLFEVVAFYNCQFANLTRAYSSLTWWLDIHFVASIS